MWCSPTGNPARNGEFYLCFIEEKFYILQFKNELFVCHAEWTWRFTRFLLTEFVLFLISWKILFSDLWWGFVCCIVHGEMTNIFVCLNVAIKKSSWLNILSISIYARSSGADLPNLPLSANFFCRPQNFVSLYLSTIVILPL